MKKLRDDNWWTSRTKLEKTLFISTLILFLSTFIVTTILAFIEYKNILIADKTRIFDSNVVQLLVDKKLNVYSDKPKQDLSNVCMTPTCVEAGMQSTVNSFTFYKNKYPFISLAHTFLNNIDESISPCDDFYRFSCGQWLNKSIIPDNRVTISTTGAIVETMEYQFKALVEEDSKPEDPEFMKNIHKMYSSCMNFSQLVYLGDDPLLKVLQELGGWPVVRGRYWNDSEFDWIDTNLKMREMGLPFNEFYHISVGIDMKNTSKHIITIGEIMPGVGGRSVMLKGFKEPDVRAYYELLMQSAIQLGANPNSFTELTKLIDFQISIVNLTISQEESRNLSKLYNKMFVKDLQSMAPNTKWMRLLSGILKQTIGAEDEVVVHNPNYVKQIDSMLTNTDKRVLANHMIADVVLNSLPLLHPKWLSLHDLYLHRITGRKAVPPRWQICVKSAASLSTAFSALYVRKYFRKESKQKVEQMVRFIHKEFIKMLNTVDWMDSSTRSQALEKAFAIKSYIAFPEQLLNDNEVSKVYINLTEYSADSYFENMLKLNKWSNDYSMKDLKEPRDKGDWQIQANAAVVNAYYSATENSIILPAGILNGLFFNYNYPDYINFGAIGTVIGHEITHAFDDIGKQFDKNGNYNNWWHSITDQRFKSKAQCLIDQYQGYVLPENGLNLNGINTLGENIADNVGVREAFRAYKAYVRENPEQQMLPGLKYTPEQLFWITFGNVWCTRSTSEINKMIVEKGSHSPPQFRVIGTVSNLQEFSESFKCLKESPMNSLNKCKVW